MIPAAINAVGASSMPAWAWLLVGLGAVSLPILAHRVGRRRVRRLVLPTARWLTPRNGRWSGRSRVRDGALLALRVGAVALLVAAFAGADRAGTGAALDPGGGTAGSGGAGGEVVLVIDCSASMARAERGATLYDRALGRARALLGEAVSRGAAVGLVWAQEAPAPALPRLTGHGAELHAALDHAPPAHGRARLGEALRIAAELPGVGRGALAESDEPRPSRARRVLVLSDRQVNEAIPAAPPGVEVVVIGVAQEARPENVGLSALSVISGPSALGAPGAPALARATVSNYGAVAADVRLRIAVDGAEVAAYERVLRVEPGQSVLSASELRGAGGGGPARVRAWIDDTSGGPGFDDARELTLEAGAFAPVVLVTGETGGGAAGAMRLLRAALEAATGAPPRVVRPAEVAASPGVPVAGLVLARAGAMPDAALEQVHSWLDGGAAVLWLVDSIDARSSLERLCARAGRAGPLEFSSDPAAAGASVGAGASDAAPAPAWIEIEPGGPLEGLTIDALPARPAVTNGAQHGAAAGPNASVWLRLSDGRPLMASTAWGRGRLAVLAADAGPERSTLGASGLLPILVAEWFGPDVAWAGREQVAPGVDPAESDLTCRVGDVPDAWSWKAGDRAGAAIGGDGPISPPTPGMVVSLALAGVLGLLTIEGLARSAGRAGARE